MRRLRELFEFSPSCRNPNLSDLEHSPKYHTVHSPSGHVDHFKSYRVKTKQKLVGGVVEQSVAWLVLAYRSPDLLRELSRSLSRSAGPVLVHVDARCNQNLFSDGEDDKVEFIESRFECPWGSFGRVSATIELIRRGLEFPVTHFALLSEDSFLLYEPGDIEMRLPGSETQVFMDLAPMGTSSKPISRISRRSPFRGDPRKQGLTLKILDFLFTGAFVNRIWKEAVRNMDLFAGDSWWVIPRKAAREIIDFVDSHPKVVEFFQSTWIADEHFFQTVLGNSVSEYNFEGSPMLANWTSGGGPNPPYFLSEKDEQWIRSNRNRHLFARKIETYSKSFSSFANRLRASKT